MSTPLRVDPEERNESIPQGYQPIPEGTSALAYDEWHYWADSGTFDVTFDPKTRRVKSVTCWLPAGPPRFCDWTFGLHEGTSEDEVVRLLGKPDVEKVEGGDYIPEIGVTGVTKQMEYRSLGLDLMLSKRQVTSITKVAPGAAGLGWWLTHRLF